MPTDLFRIETDQVVLTWAEARRGKYTAISTIDPPPGLLQIHRRRPGLQFGARTWRDGVPEAVAGDPDEIVGPRFSEQTDYSIFLQSKSDAPVTITHRDPLAHSGLSSEDGGRVVHGYVNFGSQVGRSIYSVLVDGQPEFDFEIEVFPTKIDYRDDYKRMLADVQEILTALAMEYLQTTFQFGRRAEAPQPSHIEWLTLLRRIADELERALHHIARRPVRGLIRESADVRVEQIRRVDSSLRSAVLRGAGAGRRIDLGSNLAVRERLPAHQPCQTLDTPEHRWLRAQLDRIVRRLGQLRQDEESRPQSDRRARVLRELDHLKAKIARLRTLEPMAATEAAPPPGFASLQLMTAPGYHEAYRACLVLSFGLRIEGGPFRLSAKDTSLLYEYWCYLALIQVVSEVTSTRARADDLFSIQQQGLHVHLEQGRRTTVPFDMPTGGRISVIYNPLFHSDAYLVDQKPDLLITFEDDHWRPLHLLLDAKYRVDGSPEYVQRYQTPGPPEDAINVLHRYRDAIIETEHGHLDSPALRRTVVQAAAAFPYAERFEGEFEQSRLWRALATIGVGAVPMLPDHVDYLRQWVRSCLRHGGWALADRAISHRGREQARDWRGAAAEPVLIGVLRGGYQKQHLDWIRAKRLYYLRRYSTQRLQYATKWVALYSPSLLRDPGAVTHCAPVLGVNVVARRMISTPWPAHGDPDELCVLYELGEVTELSHAIENPGSDQAGQRFSSHRWTSRLGLERARNVSELTLETEPEWRLYEQLRAAGTEFRLSPGRPAVVDPEDPAGRTWFVVAGNMGVRYAGATGFMIRHPSGSETCISRAEGVFELIARTIGG